MRSISRFALPLVAALTDIHLNVIPRKPTYRAAELGYGPLHPKAMLSPRGAPQMIGMGLLEAIAA